MSRMVVRVRGRVKRELRKLRQMTTDKGLAARCQIVLLWGEGTGWIEIGKAVGCSQSWVGRIIRRFRDHGIAGLHDRREDNGQTKLDEEYLAKLEARYFADAAHCELCRQGVPLEKVWI